MTVTEIENKLKAIGYVDCDIATGNPRINTYAIYYGGTPKERIYFSPIGKRYRNLGYVYGRFVHFPSGQSGRTVEAKTLEDLLVLYR